MKIVCQSCSAKYSIPDDKVQGKKVFKIKCKKCGEDILVRGADAGGDADASAGHGQHMQMSDDEQTRIVQSEGSDPVWHAVVNGEQSGPFSIDKLREMMATGAIDSETYVWRDGFSDWKPLREVAELSVLAGAVPDRSASPVAPAASAGGDALFGSAPASSGGLFGEAPKPAAKAVARTGGKVAAGGDLFASEPAASSSSKGLFGGGEEEDVSTSASASPRVDASKMTGARNENSVLFSLASLQQIAGASGPAKVSDPGAANKSNADQSGLIDIKSMGATLAGGDKKKAVDEILTVGGGGALASPLAAPVLAPVPTPAAAVEPEKSQGMNKTVLFSVIAVSLILGGAGIAAVVLMKNNNSAPQQTASTAAPPPATTNAPAATNAPATAQGATSATAAPAGTAPSGTQGSAPGGTTVAVNTEANAGNDTGRRDHGSSSNSSARSARSSSSGGTSSTSNTGSSAPATNTSASSSSSATPSGTGCAARCRGNIDCLLRCSTGGASAPAPSTTSASNAPEQPSRQDVISAMNGVRSAVQACGNGQTGTASVTVTFASSGRVTTANVAPPFAGTPAGSCIARAVRAASVPAFTRPTFQVTYPFVIR